MGERQTAGVFVYLRHKAESSFRYLRLLNNTVQAADGRRKHSLYGNEITHFITGIQGDSFGLLQIDHGETLKMQHLNHLYVVYL